MIVEFAIFGSPGWLDFGDAKYPQDLIVSDVITRDFLTVIE